MKILRNNTAMAAITAAVVIFTWHAFGQNQAPRKDYPIRPIRFTDVQVTDDFWAPRMETNRTVSIPTAFDQCERTGRIENFVRAAEVLRGVDLKDKHAPGFPFDDTDPY